MNNFAELNQAELTEVSGGLLFEVIVVSEFVLFAAAETYLYFANKALDAKNGK